MNAGDARSSRKCFLSAYTIFFCNSSNYSLYTSSTISSSRKTIYPCSLGISFDTGGGRDCEMTFGALDMRSVYSFCGSCSISMSVTSISFSIYWEISRSYICSPSSSVVGYFESSTCMDDVFSIIAPSLCSSSYFCFSSLSLLLNSCYYFNFFFVSYTFSYASCNLLFSLFLCSALFIRCSLFSYAAKDAFSVIGSSFILQLFCASGFSEIFLFPLSYT